MDARKEKPSRDDLFRLDVEVGLVKDESGMGLASWSEQCDI